MKLNYKIIFHFFGLLLLFNGGFMLLAALLSFFYKDGATLNLFLAGISVLVFGLISMLCTKNHTKEMNKREGYLVVAFGWIVMTLSGTLPYLFTGAIPDFTNAIFETISGYTTTGSTILNDIEVTSRRSAVLEKPYPLDWGDGNYCVSNCYFTTFRNWRNATFCSRGAGT